MIKFGIDPRNEEGEQWQSQIDCFVQENQALLAAVAWGFLQEWEDSKDILGIDLQPQPHFIRCSRTALEELNRKVDRKIQEILGILDGYNPEEEVVAIAIGKGQIKLIYFVSNPFPPVGFEEIAGKLPQAIAQLEAQMQQKIRL